VAIEALEIVHEGLELASAGAAISQAAGSIFG
jgi:hypothetical protein